MNDEYAKRLRAPTPFKSGTGCVEYHARRYLELDLTEPQATALWVEVEAHLHAVGLRRTVAEMREVTTGALDTLPRGDVLDALARVLGGGQYHWPLYRDSQDYSKQFASAVRAGIEARGYSFLPEPVPALQALSDKPRATPAMRPLQLFHAKVGDVLARITPPSGSSHGYCQTGRVVEVTDGEIVLEVQVDLLRRMRFSRETGLDAAGLGSFLVHPDYLCAETVTVSPLPTPVASVVSWTNSSYGRNYKLSWSGQAASGDQLCLLRDVLAYGDARAAAAQTSQGELRSGQ